MRFEPSGFTNNPNIKIAKSIVDYIFRYLAYKFLPPDSQRALGVNIDTNGGLAKLGEVVEDVKVDTQPDLFAAAEAKYEPVLSAPQASAHTQTFNNQSDAPACGTCGSIMVRNAACYKCLNCGATSGCS